MSKAIKLKDYQLDILSKLHTGSILVGGVGSGKSLTSVSYFYTKVIGGSLDFKRKESVSKDLYIITTAKKRNSLEWESECIKFNLTSNRSASRNNIKVTVDSWNNIKRYSDVKDSFFIFDEQRVVGWGEWAKTFVSIAKQNDWILLSATPGDTWSDYMPVFIANGFYRNQTHFIRTHVVYSRYSKFKKVDRYVDIHTLESNRNKILCVMNYTSKATQNHTMIYTDYDKELFDLVKKKRWNFKTNKPIKKYSELGYLMRYVSNSHDSRIKSVGSILKQKAKVIVFYNFTYELDQLKEFCESNNLIYSEWNGSKHELIPDSKRWVYLVQYSAGSEGWNCIETDTMIFYSPNYSYKVTKQAAGRIDRMNSPFMDLYYYHFRTKSFIDILIERAYNMKKKFNERVLEHI